MAGGTRRFMEFQPQDYGGSLKTKEAIIEAGQKYDKEFADKQKKEVDEAIRQAERSRDRQLAIYQDMANQVGDIFGRIPGDIIKNWNDMGQVLKNFLSNVLNTLASNAGRGISNYISGSIMDMIKANQMGPSIAEIKGSDSTGSLLSLGTNIASGNWLGAITSGIGLLSGMSFDNPANDAMSYKSGKSSAYALGRRSARDMVNNFEKGFKEAQGGSERPIQLQVYLDGKEISSSVKQHIDKKVARQEWSK